MAAMRYLSAHACEHHLNLERTYLTGDSAGALLALFVLALTEGAELRGAFGIKETGLRFCAAGLISIMLDITERSESTGTSNNVPSQSHSYEP